MLMVVVHVEALARCEGTNQKIWGRGYFFIRRETLYVGTMYDNSACKIVS